MTTKYYAACLPESVLEEIEIEYCHAKQKHPEPYNSPHEAASIIREEFEEFWEAVKNDPHCMAHEARQLAVTVIRTLEMLGGRYETR